MQTDSCALSGIGLEILRCEIYGLFNTLFSGLSLLGILDPREDNPTG